MSSKKHTLTLNEKVQIIELSEKEKVSAKELTIRFKCGKTQVYSVLQNKEKIMNDWVTENGSRRRKLKTTGNEKINEAVWEWFVAARAKNLPISGPILQSQALEVAKSLNITTFKASSGWLDSFKSRHGIVWNQVCGEAKDVDQSVVSDWKEKLPSLVEGYDPKNIFNGDESGLFFRALPSKTLALKGEKCVGGKVSKERLTVFLCGNMAGEMEKPLVIGKANRPRCFKKLRIDSLPVIWKSNKKAWMTGSLMEEWLINFNVRMVRQKRKVLLFLDNASCHPHVNLSNVKLLFFPPNCTSLAQPMDQGVIYTFKSHYRYSLLTALLSKIDSCNSVSEIVKEINVLDAIYWLSSAVRNIRSDTVQKCFKKAGFPSLDDCTPTTSSDDTAENMNEAIQQLCSLHEIPCDVDSYVRIDDDLSTEYTFHSATEFLCLEDSDDDDEVEEAAENQMESESPSIQGYRQALTLVQDLIEFSAHVDLSSVVQLLHDARGILQTAEAKVKTVQPTLPDFWKK